MQPHALVTATPIVVAESVSRYLGREVLVKQEGHAHPRYGGNKVRKLEWLLGDALAQGATEVITMGAAGSHHALATAVHASAAGFRVELVLGPQSYSAHAERTLRASATQAAVVHPVAALWQLPFKVLARVAALRARRRRPYVIPVGGSTPIGARGYVDAVGELASQHVGRIDAAVCALGSGGTLAGLMAGAHVHGRREVLWGVRVTPGWVSSRTFVAALASRACLGAPRVRAREVRVIDDQLGEGYGIITDAARDAMERFARDGIVLDPTYTAKAAAGLLALAPTLPRGARVLFWNTLSCASLDALDDGSPLAPSLAALLVH